MIWKFEVDDKSQKMTKTEECERCEIKFYDIGNLKAGVRVKRHMKTLHTIPCEKCEKSIPRISLT